MLPEILLSPIQCHQRSTASNLLLLNRNSNYDINSASSHFDFIMGLFTRLPFKKANCKDSNNSNFDTGRCSNSSFESNDIISVLEANFNTISIINEDFNISDPEAHSSKTGSEPILDQNHSNIETLSVFKHQQLNQDKESFKECGCCSKISSSSSPIHAAHSIIKLEKVDILEELHKRNCTATLTLLLSCLNPEDLLKVSCVSKVWHTIVFEDVGASKKKKYYLKKKKELREGPEKENKLKTCPESGSRRKSLLTPLNQSTELAQDVSYTTTTEKTKFDSFIEEGKNLRSCDVLLKCPKCNFPAKSKKEKKYCCTRNSCQYAFCKECSGPYTLLHVCHKNSSDVKERKIVIGSPQSKRNLRRLR
ncbi:F-box only protein 43-like isoform X2 [Stegodyphus dumicola]|nr:F-box only protein 43-like isoform X2 [Stegodyphus dumicola]